MLKSFFFSEFYNLMILLSSMFFIFLFKGMVISFDFFSYSLMNLTIWVGVMMVFAGISYSKNYSMKNGKSILYFFMVFFLIFAFQSKNFLSFYLFFELSMIPILIYILGWGSDLEKWEASMVMFLFTYMGSVFYLFMIFKIFMWF